MSLLVAHSVNCCNYFGGYIKGPLLFCSLLFALISACTFTFHGLAAPGMLKLISRLCANQL
jgi:hypothetical protein